MIPVSDGPQWLANQLSTRFEARPEVTASVQEIIGQVRERGDEGLRAVAERLGDSPPARFSVKQLESEQQLSPQTRALLERAAGNIEGFARAVVDGLHPVTIEHSGFRTGMRYQPVERVACYVPGGRYPLPSTALMTGLTAKAAGVREICLLCPQLHPAVVYAAKLAGIENIYQMGGAQAVAAVAFGTESVKAVDMVVGPGNAYVTEAKRQLQGVIGIDMLAGPSEVTIVADSPAKAEWMALDLLAQAEHDPDSRVYLLTPSRELAEEVSQEIVRLYGELALPDFLESSLSRSALLTFPDLEQCLEAANAIAPEHLHIHDAGLRDQVDHYGGLFVGEQATVPFGDYMAGPNHTLPTGRSARFSSGLNPLTFLRPQSWLEVNDPSQLAQDTALFADLEGLTAHAAAARARLPKA